jgi:hypothetical protein
MESQNLPRKKRGSLIPGLGVQFPTYDICCSFRTSNNKLVCTRNFKVATCNRIWFTEHFSPYFNILSDLDALIPFLGHLWKPQGPLRKFGILFLYLSTAFASTSFSKTSKKQVTEANGSS